MFTPVGYDEHPPAPPFLGEWFTDQVLRILVSNPDVWSKTVLFHMYDENDGFFDHVAPPVAPPGTDGEYLTVQPLPDDADGFAGSDRPRVPGPDARDLTLQPGRARLLTRPSTTPRSCASSRSDSGSGHPTSRPGAARRSGT